MVVKMFSFFSKKTPESESETETDTNQPVIVQHGLEDFNHVDAIAAYFKQQTGVTFENQKSILKSKLLSFCKIRKITSFEQCLAQVKNQPNLKQELINYLTTNESFFYREFHQVEDVVKKVKTLGRCVDILCAPSSTGEELYSIAIALLEAGVSESQFNLVGIDINTQALVQAKAAIYNQRNVSNLPIPVLKKYFIEKDAKYHLKDSVKHCVSLKVENIFSSSFKAMGKFDYIFSRNMLIYFDRETKIKAKNILEMLLKDNNTPIYFGHADLF